MDHVQKMNQKGQYYARYSILLHNAMAQLRLLSIRDLSWSFKAGFNGVLPKSVWPTIWPESGVKVH